jgi:hypothetical protein
MRNVDLRLWEGNSILKIITWFYLGCITYSLCHDFEQLHWLSQTAFMKPLFKSFTSHTVLTENLIFSSPLFSWFQEIIIMIIRMNRSRAVSGINLFTWDLCFVCLENYPFPFSLLNFWCNKALLDHAFILFWTGYVSKLKMLLCSYGLFYKMVFSFGVYSD